MELSVTCFVAESTMGSEDTVKDMLIKLAKELHAEDVIEKHPKELSSTIDVISNNLSSRSNVEKTQRMMESIGKELSSFGLEEKAKKMDQLWQSLQQSAPPDSFTPEIVRFLLRLGKVEVNSTERPLTLLSRPILPNVSAEFSDSETASTLSETSHSAADESSTFDSSSCVEPRNNNGCEGWQRTTYQTFVHDCIFMLQGIKTSSMEVDTLRGLRFCSQIEMPGFLKSLLTKLSWYAVKYVKLSSFCEEVNYGSWHDACTRALECAIRQELNAYLEVLVKMESEWRARIENFNEENVFDEIGLLFEQVELMLWPMKNTFSVLSSLVDVSYVGACALMSKTYVTMHTRDPEVKKITQYALTGMCSVLKQRMIDWMFMGVINSAHEEFFIQKTSECTDRIPWSETYVVDRELLPCFISYEFAKKALRTERLLTVLLVGKSVIYVRHICSYLEDIPAFERQRHLMEEQSRSSVAYTLFHSQLLTISAARMFEKFESTAFARCVNEACLHISAVVRKIMSSTFDFGFFMKVVTSVILLRRDDFFSSFIISARSELEKALPEASITRLYSFVKASLRECYKEETAARMYDWLVVELPDFECGRKAYDGVVIAYKVPEPISTVLDPSASLDYKRLFLFLWRLRRADYLMSHLINSHSSVQLRLSTLTEVLPMHRRLSSLFFVVMNLIRQLVDYAFTDVIQRASTEFFDKFNNASDFDCIVSAHRDFLSQVTDKLFLSREKLVRIITIGGARCLLDSPTSLRAHVRTLLDVVFELINTSNSVDDFLENELVQTARDEDMQQLRLKSGLWSKGDEESLLATNRREQLIDTVRSQFAPQLSRIETEYYIEAALNDCPQNKPQKWNNRYRLNLLFIYEATVIQLSQTSTNGMHKAGETVTAPLCTADESEKEDKDVSAKNIERLCSELGNAQLEENGAAGGAAVGDGSGAVKENDEELQAQGSPSLSAVERVECVPQPHLLPLWFNTECEEQLNSMNGGGDGSGGASTVIDQSGCVFSTLPAAAAVGRDSSGVVGGGDSSPKNGGCYYAVGAQATPQSFVQNKALGGGGGGGRPAAPIDACISLPAAFADHVNITIAQNDDAVCGAVPIPVGAASPSQSAAGALVVGTLPEQCVKLGVDYASGSGVGVSEELSRDELKFRLRSQLEYYFSRENLASDTYLRSQMDNDQYVPIRILANFNMVKKLSSDLDLIIEALRESPYVQVDESGEKVRPVSKRSTLILRDVPDGTEKSEVVALFNSDQCPKLLSCECALQNSWYANFESDDDAERAYIYLRDVVKTFKDKPILARFKTASIARVPNGYGTRPVPVSMTYMAPNFAIFNGSPAVGTINAIAPVENFAYTAPVNGPPMQPFVTLAPAMEAIPADASAQIGAAAAANFAQPKVVYYTPAPSQPAPTFLPVPQAAATTPFVAAAATAAMFGSTWPPFDLGQILAMNGFQPQGTFRPAVAILSAPPVAPVPSRRFPDRIRKRFSDGGGRSNYYGVGDRTPFGGNELRTPMTHHRFGHMGPRGYNDGRPYFRHHDQSVQYNGIRHRGVRQDVRYSGSSHRRGGGGGGGVRDGGGRYSGADYWASGSSSGHAKERRSGGGAAGHGPSTSGNSSSAVEKKPQSFDFQPSNFPPLPTADDQEASMDSTQRNLLKDDQKQENERSQQAPASAPSAASANTATTSLPGASTIATTVSSSLAAAAAAASGQQQKTTAEPAVSSSFCLPEDAAQAESKLSGRSQSAAASAVASSAALRGGDKRAESGGGGKETTSVVAQCPTPRSSGTTAWSQVVSGPPKRGNDKATTDGESCEAQPKAATERKRVTYADMAKLRGGGDSSSSSSSIRSNIGKISAGDLPPVIKSGSNENGVLHSDRENPSVNTAATTTTTATMSGQARGTTGAAPLNRATLLEILLLRAKYCVILLSLFSLIFHFFKEKQRRKIRLYTIYTCGPIYPVDHWRAFVGGASLFVIIIVSILYFLSWANMSSLTDPFNFCAGFLWDVRSVEPFLSVCPVTVQFFAFGGSFQVRVNGLARPFASSCRLSGFEFVIRGMRSPSSIL
ncbi:hypothetical protein M514_00501 [Trichuris suis]|uniref:HTH La-type RNA-binding domain-containing protein n=1 Tax=Trichuris suis TaxID=68888 RepID=A0A085NRK3_9BILA|nr:hypothetical protein M514_00501 [Trichuris suis]